MIGCGYACVSFRKEVIERSPFAADIEEEEDEAEEGGEASRNGAVKASSNLDSVVIASGGGGKSDPTATDSYFLDRHGSLELSLG